MSKRFLIQSALIVLMLLAAVSICVSIRVAQTAPAPIANGLNYLKTTQNADGSWGGTSTSLNGVFPTIAATLETLHSLEPAGSAQQTNAIQFLTATTVAENPFFAARINAFVGTSAGTSSDRDVLVANQNLDGGWGTANSFQSDPLDTSQVLTALSHANVSDSSITQRGLSYLLRKQNSDGGWPLTQGEESQVFYTAHGLLALGSLRFQFDTSSDQDQAIVYLRGRQNPDGGFGQPASTAFETALTLLAIYNTGKPLTTAETNAVNYLNNTQLANGSWVDDAYSTALAVRALAFPKDSDGDGMPDDWEITYGLNPNDPADALLDKDGDGLANVQEYRSRCSKPNNPDSDGDGINDGDEIRNGSDPCDPASHNRAPLINSTPLTSASQLQAYSYQVQATDADNDTLTYSFLQSPSGMNISNSGLVQWTPAANQAGSFTVIIKVSDGRASAIQQYKISVLNQGVDLTIAGVDTANASTDPQTLILGGSVRVNINNKGGNPSAGSFDVLVFADSNANGTYQPGIDAALGSGRFANSINSNSVAPFDVPVSGVVLFRDNLIYAFVDRANEIPELDETNNIGHSGLSSKYQPPAGVFQPMVKWYWDCPDCGSPYPGVPHPPLVTPWTDTNGDGLINERDTPAVVFVTDFATNGKVRALRGDTGQQIFSMAPLANIDGGFASPAVGDIDGDGKPEICTDIFNGNRIACFKNDGTLKWNGAVANTLLSTPVIADLEGDGKAEIVAGLAVYNFDGTLRWKATQSPEYHGGNALADINSPQIADLDLDGKPEIIIGPGARDRNGNTLWYWSSNLNFDGKAYTLHGRLDGGATVVTINNSDSALTDSYTAIANLDNDPNPEIIAVSLANGNNAYQSMWIFEHDGRLKAGPFHLAQNGTNQNGAYQAGPPTVADTDGDGLPEIIVPVIKNPQSPSTPTHTYSTSLSAYKYQPNGTLQLVWQKGFKREVKAPATAFDFDGDGASEIVFQDSQHVYLLNGSDGATLFQIAVDTGDAQEGNRYPTIADVDNDGVAEILIPTRSTSAAGAPPRDGVLAIGDATGNWRNARRVWNQWQYHVTNVNENGTIPLSQAKQWQLLNTHRAQGPVDGLDRHAAPDLSISKVTINSQNCPASAGITARIGNGGSLHVAPGIAVNYYLGDPAVGGVLIGAKQTTRLLLPGEFEDVTLNWNSPGAGPIFVTVNEVVTPPLVASGNLSLLPHAWSAASGFDSAAVPQQFNNGAYFGIDGKTSTAWSEANATSTGASFFEVRFPFPVNASLVTVQNTSQTTTGFLAGTLTFSNGFSTPAILNPNGEGTTTFSEQQNISWIRLTASSVKGGAASLTEFITGGTYVQPTFRINEGAGRTDNNKASSPSSLSPCNTGANRPPVITSAPPINATGGTAYGYQVIATDPNNDLLSFSLLSGPQGITMSAAGLIAWTPNDAQVGNQNVALQVADGQGGTAQQQFTIRVALSTGNHAPQITSTPLATVRFGQSYAYDVSASDADGDTVLYSMTIAPTGASLDPLTGHLAWTPASTQTGNQFFTLQAEDGRNGKATQSFMVNVLPAPAPTPTPDKDGDGFDETEDCNDNDSSVNPAQVEIPGNGKDDDCNPETPDSLPAASINCSLVTERRSYSSNSLAQLTSIIQNQSAVLTAIGLQSQLSITNSSNLKIFTGALTTPSLAPKALFRGHSAFSTGTNTPGNYSATLEVRYGQQSVCTAQASFTINSSATAATALSGNINATPGVVDRPGSTNLSYQVTNIGNADLASLEVKVLLVDTATGNNTQTLSDSTSLNQGQSLSFTKNLNTTAIAPGDYLVVLQGTVGGTTQTISSTFLRINKATFHLGASGFTVAEGCGTATITVTRTGDLTDAANVDFATSDGGALQRTDYTIASGTLSFVAGETSKTFQVLVNEDAYAEGNETLTVQLTNATNGAVLGTDASATLTIIDNETVNGSTNPLDTAGMLVCHHYHDFLNRQGDASGLAFWTNEIASCGSDQACTEVKRINVSASFFLSIEFQQTGYLVERMYKVGYGDASGLSTFNGAHQLSVPIVRINEFLRDTQRIARGVVVLQPGWEQLLESNKQAYALEFVQTSRFLNAFPTTLTPTEYVDRLNQNAGNVLSPSERTTAISLFGGANNTSNLTARAQAARQVAEDQDLYNAEFNRAFVLMQYYGYLRRNPNDPQDTDYSGYDFWLTKLNQFGGNFIQAEMVKAFLSSIEYRQRFGP